MAFYVWIDPGALLHGTLKNGWRELRGLGDPQGLLELRDRGDLQDPRDLQGQVALLRQPVDGPVKHSLIGSGSEDAVVANEG
ncbi:hypothetical protein HNR26_004584 [Rhizobium rosettiformans]|uniref:Uncharacterized protein n=1 Tax=Rhizobium rosettiformans TaxID=1368430 RepID=A0A7W8MFI1_9HYPH|nr:hypothetical protein [Rhizobium rosettiformans]